ncbi:MAG TPA: CHAT domain-containing protein [Candidatus Angelobacter sp.]|nr:CHAT domain-containing protein [Candidatus Angelobacter sp.]
MSKLYQFGKAESSGATGPCPSPKVWAEVVMGLLPQDRAFNALEHAGACSGCADELRHAMEALCSQDAVPGELGKDLATGSGDWQRNFAARLASEQPAPGAEQRVKALPTRARLGPSLARRWSMAAVAALVAAAVGLAIFSRLHRQSADTLIHEAYAQQRTIEMRIPGAGYGPVRVERANGSSPLNSPRALLEAEVLIKGELEKAPDNPELLRQKAEADLLTWNYQPAIETLSRALRVKPDSFPVLVDLSTAYFERAEAAASPADDESGLQYLGDAIRLQPANPAALFNRAILYERLYFYDRAIADWQQFLKLEHDPQWRAEGERRLKEIRTHVKEHAASQIPGQLSLSEFQRQTEGRPSAAIEEYLGAAERNILPRLDGTAAGDENYRAALALAGNLRSLHSDPFLDDLMRSAHQPGFRPAAQTLSESLVANDNGHFEQAYGLAIQSAAAFRSMGSSAGWLASLFEQSYALQFESRANACTNVAGVGSAKANRLGYAVIQIQLLLEDAICSNMSGQVGTAKRVLHRALSLAQHHGYESLYLRGLTLLAVLQSDAGDDASAWSAVQEGLALYWKSDLPPVRAYSLYTVLDRMAGRRGHANVQFAALSEALAHRGADLDRVVEASGHARLGDAALRVGDLQVAEAQFAEAQQMFAAEPQTDSIRWRELEARINLARVQSRRGADLSGTMAALTGSLPEIRRLSNRYLEFEYYDTLAELKVRSGDTLAAREFLEKAIMLAEGGTESLSTWSEKLTWMEQHRRPFIAMASLLQDSGQQEQALAGWESYRSLSGPGASETAISTVEWNPGEYRKSNFLHEDLATNPSGTSIPETRILTYAFAPEHLLIWVRGAGELHSVQVPIPQRTVQRTAENFISECGRADSDLTTLRADAHALYTWLIRPVDGWLPANGRLIIEPDGILGMVPLQALMDDSSHYLGDRYTFSIALSITATGAAQATATVPYPQHALIVAAPAALGGTLAPPPGTLTEARLVAAHFRSPELLLGSDASVRQVERDLGRNEVFHFAGHAGLSHTGAAILLADGPLGTGNSGWLHPGRLKDLQLAVFSACASARPSEMSDSRSVVAEFLQAGAHNVVASRWNVDSSATTEFMGLFYSALASDGNVARALRSASEIFRESPGHEHPYYWAAFAAFGSA